MSSVAYFSELPLSGMCHYQVREFGQTKYSKSIHHNHDVGALKMLHPHKLQTSIKLNMSEKHSDGK
jgi:hypothetical protein